MTYIFDTNALIDLKNSDINKILSMIKKGQIYSVEEVFREISKIDDTLKQTSVPQVLLRFGDLMLLMT